MSSEHSPEPVQNSSPALPSDSPQRVIVQDKEIPESNVDSSISRSTPPLLVEEPEEPYPDGGYGWICVLCSFAFHFFAIGIESTWGVYQRYFLNSHIFPATNANLAWVGSIQATGVPLIGLVAGLLAERIGYKQTSIIGSTVMSLGLIIASFSNKLWHLYLTQGLIFGLGSGLAYIPAVTILSQWFDKRRGLATGIGVSGSGIGGLVLSPLTQVFIDHVGFRWALRITGLMAFSVLTIAGLFLKTRRIPRRGTAGTRVNLALMKNKMFVFLCSIVLFSPFGFYTPIFYVPDYATNHLGLTPTDGATSVALISGLSAAGRIIMGVFGDHYGHLNTLLLCQTMGCISQMAVWPFTGSLSALMGFCCFFGFFSGGFVSLYPVVAAQIYGTERLASVAGALLSGSAPGTLAGPPIAGAILDHFTSSTGSINFVPAALYGGACMGASAIMVLVVKGIVTHSVAKAKAKGEGEKVPVWSVAPDAPQAELLARLQAGDDA